MSKSMRAEREEIREIHQDANLQKVRDKVTNKTIRIIEQFNFGEDLAEHIIDCLSKQDIQFDDKFIFKFDNPQKGKRINTSTLTLKAVNSPLKFYIGNNTERKPAQCTISFDEKQKVKSIVLSFNYLIKGFQFEQSFINLTYNADFELVESEFSERYYDQKTKKLRSIISKKDKSMLSTTEEEIFLINMRFNRDNTMLQEVLPEMWIPAAYDFTSDDYKLRLEMVDMVLV